MKAAATALLFFVSIIAAVACAPAGYAADDSAEYASGPVTNFTPGHQGDAVERKASPYPRCEATGIKASRGMRRLLFGWTDIPKTIIQTTRDSNPLWGITGGALQGVAKAFPKTVSGAVDVLSAPIGPADVSAISPEPLNKEALAEQAMVKSRTTSSVVKTAAK